MFFSSSYVPPVNLSSHRYLTTNLSDIGHSPRSHCSCSSPLQLSHLPWKVETPRPQNHGTTGKHGCALSHVQSHDSFPSPIRKSSLRASRFLLRPRRTSHDNPPPLDSVRENHTYSPGLCINRHVLFCCSLLSVLPVCRKCVDTRYLPCARMTTGLVR